MYSRSWEQKLIYQFGVHSLLALNNPRQHTIDTVRNEAYCMSESTKWVLT